MPQPWLNLSATSGDSFAAREAVESSSSSSRAAPEEEEEEDLEEEVDIQVLFFPTGSWYEGSSVKGKRQRSYADVCWRMLT